MRGEKLFGAIGNIDEKWLELAEEGEKPKPKKARTDGRFILYETEKLLGVRYIWVFLAVLLLINSAVAWSSAGNSWQSSRPADMINEFYRLYFENSGEFDEYYEEIIAYDLDQERLYAEAIRAGDFDFRVQSLPGKYSTDPRYTDKVLFELLYESIESAQSYPEYLSEIIHQAKLNLAEFESVSGLTDSYSYRYQKKVVELYEKARANVRIGVEYTSGWDAYFAYETVNVFIFIMIIMPGSVVFASERKNGVELILRSTKFGRLKTAFAKLAATLIWSSVIVLLFTLTTFAVFGFRIGFSSPDNAIQAFEGYRLSPFALTVGEYFLIGIAVKLAVFAAFAMTVVMLSALFSNYVLIFLSALGVYGLNLLLYSHNFVGSGIAAKYLNLVGLSSVEPIFMRYRAVNFFGYEFGYLGFALGMLGASALVCMTVSVFAYVKGLRPRRTGITDNAVAFLYEAEARLRSALVRRKRQSVRVHSGNLLGWEVFKTLASTRFIAVLLLLVLIKGIGVYDSIPNADSYRDEIYREYMTQLEGELTEEKMNIIAEERYFIDRTIAAQDKMREAFTSGRIDYREYNAYLSEYTYAYSRAEVLERIEHHARYLQKVEKETGIGAWFVYDTGWNELFTQKANLLLYCAILLLMTGVFAAEYTAASSSGGFAKILRATKKGRNSTFYAKLTASCMIAVILALSFGLIDVIAVAAIYDMPAANAPLLSIQYFDAVSGSMSILGYTCLFASVRIIAALALSMAVCALSELLCRNVPVLGKKIFVK